ncbi:MAG: TrmH family RNA methyltransferase [Pseudomonadota bacterium]
MDIALYQPDIPQNTAAILRTAVCLNLDVHVVGPAAFDLSDRAMGRAGLDYAARAAIKRHDSFGAFEAGARRIVLLTTSAATPLQAFKFRPDDTLLFGRESSGVPEAVHEACVHKVRIPMAPDTRSLNLSAAVAMAAFHALAATASIEQKGLA